MAIKKDSAGVEDIIFGMGTRVQLRKGSEETITELNGSHIPYSETQSTNQKIDQVESKVDAPIAGLDSHVNNLTNPHQVTSEQVGAEHDLGLPAQEGYILLSHANGVREWIAPPEPGMTSVSWGQIIGLLSQQTDLQDALNAKADAQALTDHEGATNPHGITLSGLGGEAYLDVPSVDGQVLASTVAGVRSWVTMSGGGGGDGVWGAITGDINAQTDLQNQFDTKEGHLGNPTTNGYALVSQIDGTRSWSPRTAIISWGEIIGLLSNQTDLQDALNLKLNVDNPTFTGNLTGPRVLTDSVVLANGGTLIDTNSVMGIYGAGIPNGHMTIQPSIDTTVDIDADGMTIDDNKVPVSDITETGATVINNLVYMTQAAYDALPTKVTGTVYFIVG